MRGRLARASAAAAGLVLVLGPALPAEAQSGDSTSDVAAGDRLDPDVRVVIIDAGHGGNDPGTVGITGIREKDVVLDVARRIATILERDPTIEVHLTRTSDRYLAPWKRGEMAMDLKGERVGLFLSIHANAMPGDTLTRGFEVYFLSEARTEHERRVAAMENAPAPSPGTSFRLVGDQELDVILRELLNLDAHRWSSVLAESIRGGMASTPDTRDLGVRQAPLAVITNTLMPGVLIELGYLTNRSEERRLTEARHQEGLAWGIVQGVYTFFGQYPPGGHEVVGGSGSGSNERR